MDKTLKEKIINNTFDGIDKIVESQHKNHPNESSYSICRIQEGYNDYLKISQLIIENINEEHSNFIYNVYNEGSEYNLTEKEWKLVNNFLNNYDLEFIDLSEGDVIIRRVHPSRALLRLRRPGAPHLQQDHGAPPRQAPRRLRRRRQRRPGGPVRRP